MMIISRKKSRLAIWKCPAGLLKLVTQWFKNGLFFFKHVKSSKKCYSKFHFGIFYINFLHLIKENVLF